MELVGRDRRVVVPSRRPKGNFGFRFRDIAALHVQGKIRRVRGGAEAVHPPQLGNLAGRPFRVSESVNIDKKRAIARQAVELCAQGDADK